MHFSVFLKRLKIKLKTIRKKNKETSLKVFTFFPVHILWVDCCKFVADMACLYGMQVFVVGNFCFSFVKAIRELSIIFADDIDLVFGYVNISQNKWWQR